MVKGWGSPKQPAPRQWRRPAHAQHSLESLHVIPVGLAGQRNWDQHWHEPMLLIVSWGSKSFCLWSRRLAPSASIHEGSGSVLITYREGKISSPHTVSNRQVVNQSIDEREQAEENERRNWRERWIWFEQLFNLKWSWRPGAANRFVFLWEVWARDTYF